MWTWVERDIMCHAWLYSRTVPTGGTLIVRWSPWLWEQKRKQVFPSELSKLQKTEDCRFLVLEMRASLLDLVQQCGVEAKEINHILVSIRWRILQISSVFRSDEFFIICHRFCAKLNIRIRNQDIFKMQPFEFPSSETEKLGVCSAVCNGILKSVWTAW